MSAFKENSEVKLKNVILVGILLLAKWNIFSGINDFSLYWVNKTKYSEDFGFTDEEVNSLIVKSLGSSSVTLIYQQTRVEEWYRKSIIYNPWSIMNFISDAQKPLKLINVILDWNCTHKNYWRHYYEIGSRENH